MSGEEPRKKDEGQTRDKELRCVELIPHSWELGIGLGGLGGVPEGLGSVLERLGDVPEQQRKLQRFRPRSQPERTSEWLSLEILDH